MKAAIARLETGTNTAADLALIKSIPELSKLEDPSKTTVSAVSGRPTSPTGIVRNAPVTSLSGTTYCRNVDVAYSHSTVFGELLYTWHHVIGFCYNGSTVGSFSPRYDYTSDRDSSMVIQELNRNDHWGENTSESYSILGRHIQQCVLNYGCITNDYPHSTIHTNANGGYTYSGAGS